MKKRIHYIKICGINKHIINNMKNKKKYWYRNDKGCYCRVSKRFNELIRLMVKSGKIRSAREFTSLIANNPSILKNINKILKK